MTFKIKINLSERPENIRGSNPLSIHIQEFSRAVAEGLVVIRGGFVEQSPVGGTGILRNSWNTNGPDVSKNKIEGEVTSSAIQALIIDEGAKPHFPPVGESSGLNQWVRRKLRITDPKKINQAAFLIGRKIKRQGLKKKLTFAKSFKLTEPLIDIAMDRAKDRLVERLGK